MSLVDLFDNLTYSVAMLSLTSMLLKYYCRIWRGIEIKRNVSKSIYLFKDNNRSTSTSKRCEIRSKLTIKTSERSDWRRSGVFIVNFELISFLFLVFLLLTLNKEMIAWIDTKSVNTMDQFFKKFAILTIQWLSYPFITYISFFLSIEYSARISIIEHWFFSVFNCLDILILVSRYEFGSSNRFSLKYYRRKHLIKYLTLRLPRTIWAITSC